MPINSGKPQIWKEDIAQSVDFYNSWFMRFAPKAYRATRLSTTKEVELALKLTDNLNDISPDVLRTNPGVLPMLRMATAPPIARDRLIGLAGIAPNLVRSMEIGKRIPPQMTKASLDSELLRIGRTIMKLADHDIFTWLKRKRTPSVDEIYRAATIVADRLCGAVADPIIRNAQEQRQLATIKKWLLDRGYRYVESRHVTLGTLSSGTFSFRFNVPVKQPGRTKQVNIPIDTVIMPRRAKQGDLPVLIEAKSAGDFTNTNKRRKEEATKVNQLRTTYGDKIRFVLFLCGYFDSGYLGYEAAEGIDWVWEHRIDDLGKLGL
ncbi:MAG: XamI family restriction endonuclease [Ignavibacteriae bacterium]|nr:XamI family restriction endonuclease [Ignavibacteriota bacterium]